MVLPSALYLSHTTWKYEDDSFNIEIPLFGLEMSLKTATEQFVVVLHGWKVVLNQLTSHWEVAKGTKSLRGLCAKSLKLE